MDGDNGQELLTTERWRADGTVKEEKQVEENEVKEKV